MTLGELLKKRQDAIVRGWVDRALAMYADDASAAYRRQKDPFANPVGHALRIGTQGVFEEIPPADPFLEFALLEEVVLLPVAFLAPPATGGAGD